MRIVAGTLKGLKLNEFEADNIRPTIDRVREAVFNKIQFQVKGANVLDLFCGTGAVSLEFLSRGASVTSVDNNKNSIKLIKQNFAKAKLTPNLIECDYMTALEKLKTQQFDIVFLDPPFASIFAEKSIEYIVKNDMLKSDGIIVWEHPISKKIAIPLRCEIVDEKKYGTIVVTYLVVKNG